MLIRILSIIRTQREEGHLFKLKCYEESTYSYIVSASGGCPDDTAFVIITNNVSPDAGDDFSFALCEYEQNIHQRPRICFGHGLYLNAGQAKLH